MNKSNYPNSVFVNIPTPESKFPPPKQKRTVDVDTETINATKRASKSSFAIMSNIKPRLERAGITETDLWNYIKHSNDVESRTDLDEKQWVVIEASLRAASINYLLLNTMINKVKIWKKGKSDDPDYE